jgi:predicted RNase H-like HicB family nuclease
MSKQMTAGGAPTSPTCPAFVAIGTTREEVSERIQEALSAYAEDLQQRGATLPTSHHTTGTIAA